VRGREENKQGVHAKQKGPEKGRKNASFTPRENKQMGEKTHAEKAGGEEGKKDVTRGEGM